MVWLLLGFVLLLSMGVETGVPYEPPDGAVMNSHLPEGTEGRRSNHTRV